MRQYLSTEIYLVATLLPTGGIVCLCLFLGHPSEYVWFPFCPFHVWTGLYCPGCGTLRATHYLLNGQLDTAFHYQPLLISLLPILALLIGRVFYENLRKTSTTLPFELQLYWLILIAICLFFVLRNIPLDCFECLRPPKITLSERKSKMSTWYYYDEQGEKIAVSSGKLKGLAKAGLITPETIVETEGGKSAPARKVKGLTFGTLDAMPSETAPPEPATFTFSCPNCNSTLQAKKRSAGTTKQCPTCGNAITVPAIVASLQPVETEIYGLALPPKLSYEPSSFPDFALEVNTFVAATLETDSLFTAPMPTWDNPFTAVMPLTSGGGETFLEGDLVQSGIEVLQQVGKIADAVSKSCEIVDSVLGFFDDSYE
jgi:hypothetical protein